MKFVEATKFYRKSGGSEVEGPAVNAICAPESGVNPDLSLGSKPQFGQG